MSTIAFNAASPLNRKQLDLLEQEKGPPGNLVVVDARRDPLQGDILLVDLAGAKSLGPDSPGIAGSGGPPEHLSPASRSLVNSSAWTKRAKERPGARQSLGSLMRSGGAPIRILCVHGIGHGDVDANLATDWSRLINDHLGRYNPALAVEYQFLAYDDLFDQAPHNVLTYGEAFLRLGWSGLSSAVAGLFGRRGERAAGAEAVRWSAGMVAQWAENEDLREDTRQRLGSAVKAFEPDVIVAHSLGSLISYDTFSRVKDLRGRPWDGPGLVKNRFFVSLGSQIGSAFTLKTLGGRITALASRHWFHLYNRHDKAFAAPIRLSAANYDQLNTPFNIDGVLDHKATEYLGHEVTSQGCWRSIALAKPATRAMLGTLARLGRETDRANVPNEAQRKRREREEAEIRRSVLRPVIKTKPERRALLVGINDYPSETDRLQGCVNDVFLMSALLQDIGFAAKDIRVVLNDRATSQSILDRMEWLLENTEDGMERVFYYSGHGAQIPGYGVGESVDRKDECLVTYDFDWSRDRSITDDQFHELYSQLPYTAQFYAIFDCCHSGGMTRDGGPKVRGLSPPDDIRHRALRWDSGHQMWVPRDLRSAQSDRASLIAGRKKHKGMFGDAGDISRLGCTADLRAADREFTRSTKAFKHYGPYMPVLLQASQEKQYSYEYRHGTQSFGAFTYILNKTVRRKMTKPTGNPPTWTQLMRTVARELKELHYDQTPALVCPRKLRSQTVPWLATAK